MDRSRSQNVTFAVFLTTAGRQEQLQKKKTWSTANDFYNFIMVGGSCCVMQVCAVLLHALTSVQFINKYPSD